MSAHGRAATGVDAPGSQATEVDAPGSQAAGLASRWVTLPAGARQASGLPAGFRAAGVACGIKPSGALDLGLLVSDGPLAASAARFTRSGVLAAPVLVCQRRCALDRLRAVVVNSGNANAVTGQRGLDDAAKMQGAGAIAAGVAPEAVAVASTGVIGVGLPSDRIVAGLARAYGELGDDDERFAEAIRTTDAFPKRATLELELSGGSVRIAAQAKGAGMISPRFATMLCFVETDAALCAGATDRLLGAAVARSFERISVDGQLSTNDTVLLLANGASGVELAGEADERAFAQALDALLLALALQVVRDGEGARRIARVVVEGGADDAAGVDEGVADDALPGARDGVADDASGLGAGPADSDVELVARAIANSPLIKAALHGGDPNWGRIAQAIGMALPHAAPLDFAIEIEGVPVCAGGAALAFDAAALARAVEREEVEYAVRLPGSRGRAEMFFSDLSHEYVTINAEYTT